MGRVVDAAGIAAVRARVTDIAVTAGLDRARVERLTLATSEIINNAIVHGGGSATVAVHTHRGSVVVEVRDDGGGMTAAPPPHAPEPTSTSGRGLWLVRQLCDALDIDTSAAGTTVRLTMLA